MKLIFKSYVFNIRSTIGNRQQGTEAVRLNFSVNTITIGNWGSIQTDDAVSVQRDQAGSYCKTCPNCNASGWQCAWWWTFIMV